MSAISAPPATPGTMPESGRSTAAGMGWRDRLVGPGRGRPHARRHRGGGPPGCASSRPAVPSARQSWRGSFRERPCRLPHRAHRDGANRKPRAGSSAGTPRPLVTPGPESSGRSRRHRNQVGTSSSRGRFHCGRSGARTPGSKVPRCSAARSHRPRWTRSGRGPRRRRPPTGRAPDAKRRSPMAVHPNDTQTSALKLIGSEGAAIKRAESHNAHHHRHCSSAWVPSHRQ